MCLGFEGMLVGVNGVGVVRSGVLRVADRDYEIGLSFVPDAKVGDRIIAHSGQGVRIVSQDAEVESLKSSSD
jgi:hydrogenase maturation factor